MVQAPLDTNFGHALFGSIIELAQPGAPLESL